MKRPEQQIQRALVQHLRIRGVPGMYWFAVPNGGWRSPIEARIMKGLGTQAGVPDLCFIHAGKAYFLELKAEGGRLTQSQVDAIGQINHAGGIATLANGLDEALRVLEQWGLIRREAGNKAAPEKSQAVNGEGK